MQSVAKVGAGIFAGALGAVAFSRRHASKPHDIEILVDQNRSYSLVRSKKDGQLYFLVNRDFFPTTPCGNLVPYMSWRGAARDAGLVWNEADIK
jgi:hypothetical protein